MKWISAVHRLPRRAQQLHGRVWRQARPSAEFPNLRE